MLWGTVSREVAKECGKEQFPISKRRVREGVWGNGLFETRSEGGEGGSQGGIWVQGEEAVPDVQEGLRGLEGGCGWGRVGEG